MNKILLVTILAFLSTKSYTSEIDVQVVDLDAISLKGLDRSVKKSFQQTKKIIEESRNTQDQNTEFEATSQWCMMLQNYNFFEAALECYYSQGKIDKENSKWPYLYAQTAQQLGQFEEAVIGYKETKRRNPAYLPAHYKMIEISKESGDLKSALLLLNSVPVELSLMTPVLNLSGDLYFELQSFHVAIGFYKQVLSQIPKAGALNYKIGQAYLALQDQEQAEKYISQSDSIGVKLIDPYMQEVKSQTVGEVPFLIQAKKALKFKQYDEAIENYKKALEFNPDSESGLVNLAVSYFQNQQIEQAKTIFQRVLDKNSNQTTALYNLASIALSENRLLEATKLYERFYQINPNDIEAVEKLIGLYQYNGQHQKIINIISRPEILQSGKYNSQLAKSLIQVEEFEKAVTVLEETLEQTPNDIPTLLSLAKIHSQAPNKELRNANKSLEYADKAFSLHKNIKSYWQLIHALDASKECKKLSKIVSDFVKQAQTDEKAVYQELNLQRAESNNCKI